MIRTALVLLFLATANFLGLPWLILWTWITGNPELMYRLSMKACRGAYLIAGVNVRMEGLENIPPGPCIFVANHASNLDPLALMPRIPRLVSVLMKEDIFRIPVLSTGFRLVPFISVRRSDRESGVASFEACRELLLKGIPVVIFPEGARSPDGRLRHFKKGAFVLGIDARVPIVPVSISGTRALMLPGSRTIKPGNVTVRLGPAVDAAKYTSGQRAELTARVEALVAAGLPPEQQPLATIAEAPEDPAE